MKAVQLFVKALENEGVEYIFGIPGEENIDVMDALLDSPIKFVTVADDRPPGAGGSAVATPE
ncbi:MAG TPA: thiamine pyrophosphate-binding protein [Burkholderiaceae bacterium]|nr:thiamine pyrophosphate-binding protein [Burkholderiaceae bacterium]